MTYEIKFLFCPKKADLLIWVKFWVFNIAKSQYSPVDAFTERNMLIMLGVQYGVYGLILYH